MVNGIGGTQLTTQGLGEKKIKTIVNGNTFNRTSRRVLSVPGLGVNLFSIAAVTDLGVKVVFTEDKALFTRDGRIEMTGKRVGKALYFLGIQSICPSPVTAALVNQITSAGMISFYTWQQRLAHVTPTVINRMMSHQVVKGIDFNPTDVSTTMCNGCAYGKMNRLPFPSG